MVDALDFVNDGVLSDFDAADEAFAGVQLALIQDHVLNIAHSFFSQTPSLAENLTNMRFSKDFDQWPDDIAVALGIKDGK